MAELKTKANKASVSGFLKTLPPERRKDAEAIMSLMKSATREDPAMWGTAIVGFGRLHYKYASGREGDWFKAGFSPRKDSFTLYLCGGFAPHADLMEKLGKHKTGVGCLYVKKLEDVDVKVLKQLITRTTKAAETFVPGA
ncbi:MAG: DUF1801 domain-containing protein [Vicinamibacterales bacterium]